MWCLINMICNFCLEFMRTTLIKKKIVHHHVPIVLDSNCMHILSLFIFYLYWNHQDRFFSYLQNIQRRILSYRMNNPAIFFQHQAEQWWKKQRAHYIIICKFALLVMPYFISKARSINCLGPSIKMINLTWHFDVFPMCFCVVFT